MNIHSLILAVSTWLHPQIGEREAGEQLHRKRSVGLV